MPILRLIIYTEQVGGSIPHIDRLPRYRNVNDALVKKSVCATF